MIGNPKYNYKDKVVFKIKDGDNEIYKLGEIYIVDSHGYFCMMKPDVSYDIFLKDENLLYKHIDECYVIMKVDDIIYEFIQKIDEESGTSSQSLSHKIVNNRHTLYSYNTVIAEWYDNVLIVNNTKYSVTSSQHKGKVINLAFHLGIKHHLTSKPVPKDTSKDLVKYIEGYDKLGTNILFELA